ncbi:unnamed protein product [Trichobilharzia szidati]|nr:unnamed protein product [Trichobilharzia szidati]
MKSNLWEHRLIESLRNGTNDKVKELQEELEISTGETKTTIAEFVKCLFNTSEVYYRPTIYRTISHYLHELYKSYGYFIITFEDKPLWMKSLDDAHLFNASIDDQPPDFRVCDSLLSIERTERINELREDIRRFSVLNLNYKITGEINSLFDNVKTNMKNNVTLP